MMYYFKIYKKLLEMNFHTLVAYRGNLVNSVISSLVWGVFSILSIVLITSKTKTLYGWTREEILILSGCYSIFIGFFHMIFSRNFDRFPITVNLGNLDYVLVKPLDAQFNMSLFVFNYSSILRIIFGVLFTLYMLGRIHASVGIYQVLVFTILSIAGLILLYSVWFLVIVITLWSTRLSNLTHLMFNITSVARYPQDLLRELSYFVFLFLMPLTVIVTTPTKALLGKIEVSEALVLLGLSLGFFFATRVVWKYALRFYTSASS